MALVVQVKVVKEIQVLFAHAHLTNFPLHYDVYTNWLVDLGQCPIYIYIYYQRREQDFQKSCSLANWHSLGVLRNEGRIRDNARPCLPP